jgi:hypothetical protein
MNFEPFTLREDSLFRSHIEVPYGRAFDQKSSSGISLHDDVEFDLLWCDDALFFKVLFPKKQKFSVDFPNYRSKDALELFIDTRGLKNVRIMHRFCHQFVVFPEAFEGVFSREITRIRGVETRKLFEPNTLRLHHGKEHDKTFYSLEIPSESLFSFDPIEFPTCGFGFTLYREGFDPVSFPFEPRILEKSPHMWATLHFQKKNEA